MRVNKWTSFFYFRAMKKIGFLLLNLIVVMLSAQTKTELYIEKYSSMAIAEMNQFGIPASITLAQGILESGNGESRLATEGNNHFGIKCHSNWSGKTIIKDDDEKEVIIIERKTINDLSSSIRDSRYYEQSFRLSECNIPNHYIYYLIECLRRIKISRKTQTSK